MKHYVYRLDDIISGEFYFGSRTCNCEINCDTYMGSMKKWKPNKSPNLGKKFDDNWKNNISEGRIKNKTALGSKNPNSYGNVKIVDLNKNVLLFDTAKEASIFLNVDRHTLTTHCKNNTTYQRGKYKGWLFSIIKNID